MLKLFRYWSIFASFLVTLTVVILLWFILKNAIPAINIKLFFGDTRPFDAIFQKTFVWDGLWTALRGTIKLLALSGIFAIPMGVSIGIYLSEYAGKRAEKFIVTILESLSGLPSIIVGLYGFVLILFLHRYIFPANTNILLAAFCLSILVLPSLSLNTYTAIKTLPDSLRLTATSLGLSKETTIFKLLIPAAAEGIFSGLFFAAARCAEDTAVILMTGAVASAGNSTGLLDKFEALPFFIFYTSANYQDETELSQLFVAAFLLLLITFVTLFMGTLLKKRGLNG